MSMTKKYQCPNCGVAMEFHPETQLLHCEYCNSSFTPKRLAAMERATAEETADAGQTIQMRILHCQSCGAELAVNGTEASTFCAFCGQATVVTDRLEGWLKPDCIIPFKVTKEEAYAAICDKLSKGRFIPQEIRDFKAERLSGIYIPHLLFDVYYAEDQVWTYSVQGGKRSVSKQCRRAAESMFYDVPVDVSLHMPDGASQRLEPYNVRDLKPFNAAYLSGFYSDRYDVSRETAKETAVTRVSDMFNDRMKTEMEMNYGKPVSRVSRDSLSEALHARYTLLPAWIMTFRKHGKPYNIMVNGQTGKVACALPFEKTKVFLLYALMLLLFCVPLGLYGGYVFLPLHRALEPIALELAFAADILFLGGLGYAAYYCIRKILKMWGSFREHMALTNSSETEQYVRERQGTSV